MILKGDVKIVDKKVLTKIKESLTPKQLLFVQNLLKEPLMDTTARNKAYKDAFKCCGRTARISSSEMIKNTKIKMIIEAELENRAIRASITPEKVIAEYAKIGFCTIDPSQVKATDKISALKEIAKMLGFVTDEKVGGDANTINYIFKLWEPPKELPEHLELLEEVDEEESEEDE